MQETKKKKRELELVDEKHASLMGKVFGFFETTSFGMSRTQIRKFVLNPIDFPTPFSRWRQAKVELWMRLQSLYSLHFDYREALANIELEKARIEKWSQVGGDVEMAKVKLSQVMIEKNLFKVRTIKKMVADKLKEMDVFYEAVMEEQPKVSDDEEREDERFWAEKVKRNPNEFKSRYDITE